MRMNLVTIRGKIAKIKVEIYEAICDLRLKGNIL